MYTYIYIHNPVQLASIILSIIGGFYQHCWHRIIGQRLSVIRQCLDMHNMIDCTTIYSHMHQVCGFNAHRYIVPGLQFPTEDCIRCWDCDVQHSFVHTANSVLCHQEGNNCCKWSTKLYYCLNVCICSSVTGPPWGGRTGDTSPRPPNF